MASVQKYWLEFLSLLYRKQLKVVKNIIFCPSLLNCWMGWVYLKHLSLVVWDSLYLEPQLSVLCRASCSSVALMVTRREGVAWLPGESCLHFGVEILETETSLSWYKILTLSRGKNCSKSIANSWFQRSVIKCAFLGGGCGVWHGSFSTNVAEKYNEAMRSSSWQGVLVSSFYHFLSDFCRSL